MEIIAYTPGMTILNTAQLPKGLGAKFLVCIRAHNGELLAARWARKMPKDAEVVIQF